MNFYMTLPSNTKLDGNTTSNFRVRLPQKIQLDGDWEVALVEIMYPHSWYNVSGHEITKKDMLLNKMHPNSFYIWIYDHFFVHCLVPTNYYGNVKKLLNAIELGLQYAITLSKTRLGSDAQKRTSFFETNVQNLRDQVLKEQKKLEATIKTRKLREKAADNLKQTTSLEATIKKRKLKEKAADRLKQRYEKVYKDLQRQIKSQEEALADWLVKAETFKGGKLQNLVKFEYDSILHRVHVELDPQIVTHVKLSPNLAYMLGYEEDATFKKRKNYAPFQPDLRNGFYALYVYCTIAENQIVGNYRVPLLRAVHVEGEHGDIREKIFQTPHYVPITAKEFDTVELDIKDDRNQSVHFAFGKVIVKLHFRKQRMNL